MPANCASEALGRHERLGRGTFRSPGVESYLDLETAFRTAPGAHCCAVNGRDRPGDRQAKTGSAAARSCFEATEWLEKRRHQIRRDERPGVADPQESDAIADARSQR